VKALLIFLTLILFGIFLGGLLWLSSVGGPDTGSLLFVIALAFAAGLSMIILPCTLPLAFIIVPMSASENYKKGLIMASLFGLGLAVTITIYGVLMAYLGQILGLGAAAPIILTVAGISAYLFGLRQTGILKLKIPFLSTIMPESIQKQGDYVRSFSLGLLLGNAGVGCPNPLFYVLLIYIAGSADLFTGALVGFSHGLGRATPILLLSILAMLGFQATKALSENRLTIEKITGWSLIFIGAFLIPTGIFDLRGWWLTQGVELAPLAIMIKLILLPLVYVKIHRHIN
jgi:cytochrome c-type biogenesis protein